MTCYDHEAWERELLQHGSRDTWTLPALREKPGPLIYECPLCHGLGGGEDELHACPLCEDQCYLTERQHAAWLRSQPEPAPEPEVSASIVVSRLRAVLAWVLALLATGAQVVLGETGRGRR